MELYPLDKQDIAAIGRSRANRTMPKNVKQWLYGGLIVFAAGIIYWVFNGGWSSLGVMAVGAGITWYSTILSDKWRKKVIIEVNKMWRTEQEKSGVK